MLYGTDGQCRAGNAFNVTCFVVRTERLDIGVIWNIRWGYKDVCIPMFSVNLMKIPQHIAFRQSIYIMVSVLYTASISDCALALNTEFICEDCYNFIWKWNHVTEKFTFWLGLCWFDYVAIYYWLAWFWKIIVARCRVLCLTVRWLHSITFHFQKT